MPEVRSRRPRSLRLRVLQLASACVLLVYACAGEPGSEGAPADLSPSDSSHYLRYVAFHVSSGKGTVMRWQSSQMPLRVHFPPPPEGMFRDPTAVTAAVRRGIVDWTDVVSPGVPSFVFVESPETADIPVVWAPVSQGWWVAFCAYDLHTDSKIFRINRILVAAKYPSGEEAKNEEIYMTLLHEMGHALGMLGHSPQAADVMYEKGHWDSDGMTARDRNTLRALYTKPVGASVPGAIHSRD